MDFSEVCPISTLKELSKKPRLFISSLCQVGHWCTLLLCVFFIGALLTGCFLKCRDALLGEVREDKIVCAKSWKQNQGWML